MADAPTLARTKLDRVGNIGVGEQILLRMFTPANFFRKEGDNIFIHATAILAANGNSKTTKLYIGGTVVGGRTATDNNSVHDIRVRAYRRGSGLWSIGLTANLVTALQLVQQNDIVLDLNGPIEIKLTGDATADNDVVSRVLFYRYTPVGSTFEF